MKIIDRLIALLFVLCLISVFSLNGLAAKENENYKKLLDVGYPEIYLDELSYTALEKTVASLENYAVTDVETNVTPWPDELSGDKAECTVITVIAELSDKDTKQIKGKSVGVFLKMDDNSLFSDDALIIKWDEDDFSYCTDSFYAEDYERKNIEDKWNIINTHKVLAGANQNGVKHIAELNSFSKKTGAFMLIVLDSARPFENDEHLCNKIEVDYYRDTDTTEIVLLVSVIFSAVIIVAVLIKRCFKTVKKTP